MEDITFWKSLANGIVASKYFLVTVSYISGIISSVIIFRVNDRYKRKSDLLGSLSIAVNILEQSKNFSGKKIDSAELQRIRNVFNSKAKSDFDNFMSLIHTYNSMPRNDGSATVNNLKRFHTEKLYPAIIEILKQIKKHEQ